MATNSFHFTVGYIHCIVVNDGNLAYSEPARVHFANAPADELAEALQGCGVQLETWREWISPLPCLVIQTGARQVLVDTGLGAVDFAPAAGKLLKNLRAEGIHPEDIDAVVLTHAHQDHIGGNAGPDGLAAFPRARYIMRKEEWDYWTSAATLAEFNDTELNACVQAQLLSLSDCIELLEEDREIAPGVHSLFTPGHTPGHMAVTITSNGEQLICLGDALTHPLHLEHPNWSVCVDYQPEQVAQTRRHLLEQAVEQQALVFAFHFDFPGLGYVRKARGAWKWQPISPNGS